MTGGVEDDMDDVSQMAESLGIQGESDSEDAGTTSEEGDSATVETSETDEPSSTGKTEELADSPGGIDESEYPNPDKEIGSLRDTYENINMFLPPEVNEEAHRLFKKLEYENSLQNGEDLDKHWDFYTALFRVVLRNEDLLRDELGIDKTE